MARWPIPILCAIALAGSLLRFLPWLSTPLWGSDSGEYWALASELVRDGRVAAPRYEGWGEAYPYFLGLEYLAGAMALLTGLPVLTCLALLPSVISFPTPFLVYLIAMRICPAPAMGLGAAAVVAVAMPHAFATSHPMPGALGDLLVIASLFAFLRIADSRHFLALLGVLAPALIITHHLSTYMFVVAAAGGLLVRELLATRRDRGRVWLEAGALAAILSMAGAYWWIYADGFRRGVLEKSFPGLAPVLFAGVVLAILLLPLLLPRLPRLRYRPQLPGMSKIALRALLFTGVVAAIIAGSVVLGVPATSIRIPAESALLFIPLLGLFFFAILGSKVVDFLPEGNNVYGWAAGLAASTGVASLAGAIALSPYRHVQYFVLPLALLAGAGLMHLSALLGSREGRRQVLAASIAALAAGSAAGAYPPPELLAGFDESLHPQDVAMVHWVRMELSRCHDTPGCFGTRDRPNFASDHRLSSALYSFAHVYATWDTTPRLLHNDTFDDGVKDEVTAPDSPHSPRRVQYVAHDRTMERGLALDPNAQASPPSAAAVSKFAECPFVRIYDNGYARVYLLDWGAKCG